MTYRAKVWTDKRWKLAQDMRDTGCDMEHIARAVKLTPKQVQDKFTNECYHHKASAERQRMADKLAERDAAFAAPQSLTATIFGDPLPGRSALDKKGMGGNP